MMSFVSISSSFLCTRMHMDSFFLIFLTRILPSSVDVRLGFNAPRCHRITPWLILLLIKRLVNGCRWLVEYFARTFTIRKRMEDFHSIILTYLHYLLNRTYARTWLFLSFQRRDSSTCQYALYILANTKIFPVVRWLIQYKYINNYKQKMPWISFTLEKYTFGLN